MNDIAPREVGPEQAALDFLQPDEAAAQFLARTYTQPFLTGVGLLDRRMPLTGTSVMEVCGVAGTGKTELLLSVAATCLLPASAEGVSYSGYGGHVLYFDLDCKFDILRLVQILQARVELALRAAGVGVPPDDRSSEARVRALVEECVGRLVLVRCPSSFHLLAALKVVRPLVVGMADSGGLAAVMVDNVTAHFYTDKVAAGGGVSSSRSAQTGSITREGAPLTLFRVHAAMAAALKQVQQVHRVPIFATNHILTSGGSDADTADGWAPRDVMTKPWQTVVTHRLMLRHSSGPRERASYSSGGSPPSRGHISKWNKPALPRVDTFAIGEGGILPCV